MRPSSTLMLGVFTLALFLSATLLFLVQPMVGRMLLPLLGGAPALWNTCMVFFQATLLGGYLYVHATTCLGVRRQILLHAGLLLLPFLVLPITVHTHWLHPGEANPIFQILALLAVSVGLPFFMVATSAPLLQRWFASTGSPTAGDPYFLYGVSNLGSMLALLGYPVLVEPHLHLAMQSQLWTVGYGVLVLGTLGCAGLVWRATSPVTPGPVHAPGQSTQGAGWETAARLSSSQCLHWVVLACVPSSLMLGATTYITTDIAAIPLLWILPLGLYLLSFILVFARLPQALHHSMVTAAPIVLLVLVFLTIAHSVPAFWRTWMTIVLHLLVLFVVAMVCHGELARSRPPARQLTAFYLWMSVGGVAGGLFNTLLAPRLFTTVAEYPLVLVLACFLFPSARVVSTPPGWRWPDLAVPLALAVLMFALTSQAFEISVHPDRLSTFLSLDPEQLNDFFLQWFSFDLRRLNIFLKFGVPVVLCYLCTHRFLRFGLSVGAIVLVSLLWGEGTRDVLHRERSFFGALQVKRVHNYHQLTHGTTTHGTQFREALLRQEPTTYYHRTGPIGQVFAAFEDTPILNHIAAVGLGTGTLACYGEPGRTLTFYEIDPAVYRIASEPRYFTYLQDAIARGTSLQVVLGDARLKLAGAPERHYGLMIIDAFSSDAIPVHLLTREALQLYVAKLADGGLLALHITNRHLDLAPVLGNLAQDLQLTGRLQRDAADPASGKVASWWIVLARHPHDLDRLSSDAAHWKPLPTRADVGVWTDDFSNLLRVFQWQK